jgi:cobalt/nickel transport system ATP-binding protein
VLLLDEPTNSLDEKATLRLLEILLRLPQSIILVSHDREFRRQVTDHAYLLNQGCLE